jgi:hypothetical protein
MNFEELLKYCTELNKSKNEKCLVCHIPVDSDEKYIKLVCSHIFHPDCVKYKSGSIKCLYCEKSSIPSLINYSNSLPLAPDVIYCKILLKTGTNKGKFCNRHNCQYHKINSKPVQVINIETNKPVKVVKPKAKTKQKNIGCQILIKTGPKAGNLCSRIDCKYHKYVQNNNDKELNKKTKFSKNKITNMVEPITEQKITFNQILQMNSNDFVDYKDGDEDLIEI